jgi:putative restriction endonuclease
MAGISGAGAEGADSIVVSGGYEDDVDAGDEIVYTGHGGNDPTTHKQIADQTLTVGNLALARSCLDGLPVRVIRGASGDRGYSPPSGFRYDGLYYVDHYWHQKGRSGFRIWRFHLVKEPDTPSPKRILAEIWEAPARPARTATEVQRLVRRTEAVQKVKQLHDYTCQICGMRLETPAGPYAEGAHIRPLGRPHDGPDVIENVLCLCPNDHVRFAYGEIMVLDDLTIVGRDGTAQGHLRVAPDHALVKEYLAYHRERFAAM